MNSRFAKSAAMAALVILVIGGGHVGSGVAFGQGAPPVNLPPAGSYQAIPNFTGPGAGLLFRSAINDRFSGVQQISPRIVTLAYSALPAESDGSLIYCTDCQKTVPCSAGGSGAWAMGQNGQWACSSSTSGAPTGTSGGDLSGAYPNPTVSTVLGGKVPLYGGEIGAQINTLSGSKGDGSDAIAAMSVNGVQNAIAWGAACSSTTAQATTSSSSASVSLNAIGDFKAGQSIQIDHAGPAATVTTPANLSVRLGAMASPGYQFNAPTGCFTDPDNTSCSTSYTYQVAAVDKAGGISALSSATSVTGAWSVLNVEHTIDLQWTKGANDIGYAIYRCAGASCSPTLYYVVPAFQFDNSGSGMNMGRSHVEWIDIGESLGRDPYLGSVGASPPALPVAQHFYAKITAASGSNLTLSASPSAGGTFTMRHDDSVALNAAIAYANAQRGGGVQGGSVMLPICPSGSSGSYQIGQSVSLYDTASVRIEGQGGGGHGIRPTVIQWNGPVGGSVFNMNQAQQDEIDYVSIPGFAGTTPGVGFDVDTYDTGSGINLVATGDRFRGNEVGGVAYRFSFCGRGTNNCDLMTMEDNYIDDGGTGNNGFVGIYYGWNQCFRENWKDGANQAGAIAFLFEGGSGSIRGAEISDDVNLWTTQVGDGVLVEGSNLEWNGGDNRYSVVWNAGANVGVTFVGNHINTNAPPGTNLAVVTDDGVFVGNNWGSRFGKGKIGKNGASNNYWQSINSIGDWFNGLDPAPFSLNRWYRALDFGGFASSQPLNSWDLWGLNQSTLPATFPNGIQYIHATRISDPSSGPSVQQNGTTGSSSYQYAIVCKDANGGATLPSSFSTINNANATLGAQNYISINWAPGQTPDRCDPLRTVSVDVLKGDAAHAICLNANYPGGECDDTGQATTAYTAPTRNTTGDIVADGALQLAATNFAKLPASASNGARVYCPDCDPPANPAAACTSSGTKTGAFADRINGAWLCVP